MRNPLNLATSYIDLDFMYGRSVEEAEALRTMENGYMNLTEDGMPVRNDDGTWLVSVRYEDRDAFHRRASRLFCECLRQGLW